MKLASNFFNGRLILKKTNKIDNMSKEYFPFFNLLYTAVRREKIEEKTRDNFVASNEWVFLLTD